VPLPLGNLESNPERYHYHLFIIYRTYFLWIVIESSKFDFIVIRAITSHEQYTKMKLPTDHIFRVVGAI
jgi:hypothetical protein